jgi:PKHD-type hydroxylase
MFTTNVETVGKIIYPYVYLHNAFGEEQLKAIESYGDQLVAKDASIMNETISTQKRKKNKINVKDIRDSKVAWIQPEPSINWFFDEYFYKVAKLNNDFYRFDLFGFNAFQYTLYDTLGAKYDDHMDLIMGPIHDKHLVRKLSTILFLQDKSDFEGGEFQIFSSSRDLITIEQKRGTLICFPSWMLHQVTPITAGSRKSIVAWVEGPMFK